jgi:hypothetical protein
LRHQLSIAALIGKAITGMSQGSAINYFEVLFDLSILRVFQFF